MWKLTWKRKKFATLQPSKKMFYTKLTTVGSGTIHLSMLIVFLTFYSQLQVENKRVQDREDRVSKARQLKPVERTRKDQLEEYRREKLRAQEKLNKKTVVPFR